MVKIERVFLPVCSLSRSNVLSRCGLTTKEKCKKSTWVGVRSAIKLDRDAFMLSCVMRTYVHDIKQMRATYRFIAPVDFKGGKRQMFLITCSRRKRRVSIPSTTAYPTLSRSAVYQEARFGQQRELVTVVVAHSPCKCFFLSLSSSLSLSLSLSREGKRKRGGEERGTS